MTMQLAEEALEWRLRGYTYHRIGEEMECPPGTAERRVKLALEWRLSQKIDYYRAQEDARLDRIVERLEAIIHASDEQVSVDHRINALKQLLRTVETRARLHGLNAPVQVEAKVITMTAEDEEMQQMIAKAKERIGSPHLTVVPGEVVAEG